MAVERSALLAGYSAAYTRFKNTWLEYQTLPWIKPGVSIILAWIFVAARCLHAAVYSIVNMVKYP